MTTKPKPSYEVGSTVSGLIGAIRELNSALDKARDAGLIVTVSLHPAAKRVQAIISYEVTL